MNTDPINENSQAEAVSHTEGQQPDARPVEPQGPEQVSPTHRNKKRLILYGVFLGIVIFLAAIAVLFFLNTRTDQPAISTDEKTTDTKQMRQLDRFASPTTGERWFDEPKPVMLEGVFVTTKEPQYFEVGTRNKNTIILAHDGLDTASLSSWRLFERNPENAVTLIVRPQSTVTYSNDILSVIKQNVNEAAVSFDNTTTYDSLSVPDELQIKDEVVSRLDRVGVGAVYQKTVDELTRQKIADYGQNSLFKLVEFDQVTSLNKLFYEVFTPMQTRIRMEYKPHSLQLADYSWKNNKSAYYLDNQGNSVADILMPAVEKCTSTLPFVTVSTKISDSDLVEAGATDKGEPVYHLSDPNHSLLKTMYQLYSTRAKNENRTPVDKNEYYNSHGIVIIKNQDAENLVYTLVRFSPTDPCW